LLAFSLAFHCVAVSFHAVISYCWLSDNSHRHWPPGFHFLLAAHIACRHYWLRQVIVGFFGFSFSLFPAIADISRLAADSHAAAGFHFFFMFHVVADSFLRLSFMPGLLLLFSLFDFHIFWLFWLLTLAFQPLPLRFV